MRPPRIKDHSVSGKRRQPSLTLYGFDGHRTSDQRSRIDGRATTHGLWIRRTSHQRSALGNRRPCSNSLPVDSTGRNSYQLSRIDGSATTHGLEIGRMSQRRSGRESTAVPLLTGCGFDGYYNSDQIEGRRQRRHSHSVDSMDRAPAISCSGLTAGPPLTVCGFDAYRTDD